MTSRAIYAWCLFLQFLFSGCGTYVPQLHEDWEEADISDRLVYRIQKSIYCELRTAISHLGPLQAYYRTGYVDNIPDDWGVQTTLQLQVDETGAVNPTVTLIPSATLSLPLTAQLSSQATRIDKYYSFFSVRDMKKEIKEGDTACTQGDGSALDHHGSSFLLSGDLGIEAWMKGALDARAAIPSSQFPNSQTTKLDVISYDIKFIVITSGSINPTFKFAKVATGGGVPLLSGNRSRTHDLLVTLGPTVLSKPSPHALPSVFPAGAATNVHLTGEIQQAFSSALQTLVVPTR